MANENVKHQASRIQVFGVVSFYMVAALIMVLANKWTLNGTSLPLTFLFMQLVIAVILIQVCNLFKLITLPPIDPQLCKDIAAVVVVNVVGLVFNTLCLKAIDASYFQVARGLVLPLTVVLASLLLKSMPPKSTIACCILVTIGFGYGVTPSAASSTNNQGNSRLGIIFGVLSAVMIALHAILVKWSMRKVAIKDIDSTFVVNLAYLTNLGSAILLFPVLIIIGEVWNWAPLLLGNAAELRTFLVGSAITGVFGFLICMAGLLSITVTSPISHMFSSAVRSVLQTILAMAFFGDILTTPRAISIGFILAGSSLYAYFKAATPPPAKTGGTHDKLDDDIEKGADKEESMPMLTAEESKRSSS